MTCYQAVSKTAHEDWPMSLFVQIAAYRDPELVPTLRALFAQAKWPHQLSVGLCWQFADGESLEEFDSDPRIRRVAVAAEHSQGVCWARRITQSLYRDETYTLQLDSHHRFARHWDETLIKAHVHLKAQGVDRPLITAYLPTYQPDQPQEEWSTDPLRMNFGGFTHKGPWAVKPEQIPHVVQGELEPARFVSGHFLFTEGAFCHRVPYDPQLYFFGEEQSLSVRAFCQGYQAFHPKFVCAWHYYGRLDQPKHWSDVADWGVLNERSFERYNALMAGASDLGECGLGDVRSIEDFGSALGVDVINRKVSDRVLAGQPPKLDQTDHCRWSAVRVPINAALCCVEDDRLAFVYVGAHDADGEELYRYDVTTDALKTALRDGYIDVAFESGVVGQSPDRSWTIWPHAEQTGWLGSEKVDVVW